MSAGKTMRRKSQELLNRLRGWPKWVRLPIGILLVVGGLLGFLPVLGFWMVPLGLAVLAIDIPVAAKAYRWLRRQAIRLIRRVRGRRKSDA